MSETETAPQGGGAAASESAATTDTEALAPGTEGAATETPVESTPKPTREERRWAIMSAKFSAAEARAASLAAENERLRRGTPAEGDQTEATRAEAHRMATEMVAEERAKDRMAKFHADGRAAHADWSERCQNLMSMGADAGLSHILVEMDNGARVAGALADDPEALERIAGIQTERGRAISLGMYAAQLAEKPAPPVRRVSNAPAPIRPVTGSAPVAFNEYTATSEQLTEFYSKQAMKARGL